MATLNPTSAARSANPLTAVAADPAGDQFANDGRKLLLIEHTNDAGSTVTLTADVQKSVDGETVTDKTIDIGAGETHLIGPFPTGIYNDNDGNVQLTYSAATDIELTLLGI